MLKIEAFDSQKDGISKVGELIKAAQGMIAGPITTGLVNTGNNPEQANWAVFANSELVCLCGKRSAENSQDVAALVATLLSAIAAPK